MIMSLCHRLATPLHTAVFVLVSFALSPGARAATSLDTNATVVSAESALQRGDCGLASRQYRLSAQQLAQVELASRATEVALACGQSDEALVAADRWVKLAPGDSDAALAQVRAELVAYRIAEARAHFKTWLGVADRNVPDAIDALAQSAGNEPALAMFRDLDHPALKSAEAQRALAELALQTWDAGAALRFAQGARVAASKGPGVAGLIARAQAIQGNETAALSAAREAVAEKGGALTLAQVQLLLGQDEAAEKELQRLRGDKEVGAPASRQLAQLAFERGDYAVAEQRCDALLREPNSAPLAVYLLGVLNERRGDDSTALRNYRLLLGTGFEGQGKRRAAVILYRQGERASALRLLEATRGADPQERIRAEIGAADLLSLVDAPDEALGHIDGALRRSPGNPELDYQRAVLLERDGKVDAALALLESLHRVRPLDAAITNALGFTLADHKRTLPRAEQLIREALQSQPDDPAMLDSLGWVLYRRGQAGAAAPILARAYRLLHDGDIGAHWGEALWAAGQKAAATAAWQRALAADPDNAHLTMTVAHYAPNLAAPKPPPALEAAPRTSI